MWFADVYWLWSIAFYTAAIVALIGAVGIVRPLRRVHRSRRTHAAVMLLVGLIAMYAISRMMPHSQAPTTGCSCERSAADRAA